MMRLYSPGLGFLGFRVSGLRVYHVVRSQCRGIDNSRCELPKAMRIEGLIPPTVLCPFLHTSEPIKIDRWMYYIIPAT
jgi:hypothetical protein